MDQPADWIEIIENSQEKVRLLQQTKYLHEQKIRDIETEILEEKMKLYMNVSHYTGNMNWLLSENKVPMVKDLHIVNVVAIQTKRLMQGNSN